MYIWTATKSPMGSCPEVKENNCFSPNFDEKEIAQNLKSFGTEKESLFKDLCLRIRQIFKRGANCNIFLRRKGCYSAHDMHRR